MPAAVKYCVYRVQNAPGNAADSFSNALALSVPDGTFVLLRRCVLLCVLLRTQHASAPPPHYILIPPPP